MAERGRSQQKNADLSVRDWMAARNAQARGEPRRQGARNGRRLDGQAVLDQTLAGARGAQDALTLGMGDKVWAGGNAIGDALHGKDLVRAYRDREAAERDRDRYDEQHFKTARIAGQVAGTTAQVLALGPAEGLVAGGARMAEAAPLIGRELAAIGGAGGASGLSGQALSDLENHKFSSLGDYAGAALGGTAGALAARSGLGSRSGAIDGGVTSLAQDAFNQRLSAASIDRARTAALLGGTFGAIGGYAGRNWSNGLPRKVKGDLGEDLSKLRSRARGQRVKTGDGARKAQDVGGGYTIPDHITTDDAGEVVNIVEAKFGRKPSLSKNQKKAYAGKIPNYRVDHFLPQDIGATAGLGLAQFGRRDRNTDQAPSSNSPKTGGR